MQPAHRHRLHPDPDHRRRHPAAFYPFYTKGQTAQGCRWSIGNDIRGFTQNDFGRNAQYGQLAADPHLKFGGGGAAAPRFANFRQFRANPC